MKKPEKMILEKDNPILRRKSVEVPISEISSAKIQGILKEMAESLSTQPDGVAIAAPQLGYPLRIFIVSKKVLNEAQENGNRALHSNIVFINPRILKLSKETQLMEEGCLSVRWLYGKVRRACRATVVGYNEKGEKITRGASALLAQIFQHEVDHLEGILFIDKAKDLREILPNYGKIGEKLI
ncbi:MAG: peptide deformylase [bacterium]|nr:peptide deformylase [bacterium]